MKFSPYTWEDLTGLEELVPEQVNRVREILVLAGADPSMGLNDLFAILLAPYYDDLAAYPVGLNSAACGIVYRLSDGIDEKRRQLVQLSPEQTLEQWRKEWEGRYQKGPLGIPFVTGNKPELPQ